jgi:acid phosphatase
MICLVARASVAGSGLLLALAACGSTGQAPVSPTAGGHGSSVPGTASAPTPAPDPAPPAAAPRPGAPAHTVIVIMENHSYNEVIGSPAAPYINALARQGALLTNSYAVTHPSEPNYLALFSGSTQGITDDSCPHTFTGPNLASELTAAGRTFAGYAESLPPGGAAVCSAGGYARKHVPWADFRDVPAAATRPMSAFPVTTAGYAALPTLSFVIPNLCHDMHDCPVATGDAWLRAHLSGYAAWAMTHHSLLIVDWDENDFSPGNHIATIFAGQMVRPGRYGEPATHYRVLRTLEYLYRLPPLGAAAHTRPLASVWK